MSANATQDTIDLKAIFRKLMAKWWLFAITCTVFVALAVAYLKTTPKRYAVSGVMLMSEQKRNSFGGGLDREFLKGTAYLSNNGDLEDQISVLMSYSTMLKTVQRLDFGVSYYEERNFKRQESYSTKPFIIKPDTGLQVAELEIDLVPNVAAGTYRVKGKGKNVRMFDTRTGRMVDDFREHWEVDQEGRIGEPFRHEFLNFTIEFPKGRTYSDKVKYSFAFHSLEGLAGYWRSATSTTPQSDDSNIITISTAGEVVQKQKDFINMLMLTYIELEQAKQNEKGNRTIKFIDEQLSQSTQKLSDAEGRLQQAQTTGGSLVGSAGDRSTQLYNDMSRLQDERSRVSSQVQALTEMIDRMGSEDPSTGSTISMLNINDPALANAIDSYNRDMNELSQRRLTERQPTPSTIALNRKVQSSRAQILQSAKDARRSNQLLINELSGRIGNINHQLGLLPSATRQVSIATRNFELTAEMNNYLVEKRYEAEIAVNSDQVDKYVVDEARQAMPGPVAPDKKTALGGALLLGLLLPVMFIIIKDFFTDRISDLDELKRLSPIPVLASIPTSKQKRINLDDTRSMLAESFRTARINLQYLNADVPRQVVGLTSSTSGEGKTFCSINLATVLALSGKRTLLIDADMRRPRVHEYLELPEGTGLSSYLVGETDMDRMVRKSNIPGLDVITAGPIPPNPLELMEANRMQELFQHMRSRYDRIVVDASPMGLVSEYVILMKQVDITLYVVRQGYTNRGALRFVNEMYQSNKVGRIDLLLNDVKAGRSGYGEGYYTAS
ncbi:MAG TPA: polysaccharide biosynthesis tyrosine autokinase [Flavobacteriales bacterium]